MKSLVIYDSQFGNTKTVAETIADVLSREGICPALHVNQVQTGDLDDLDLLVVGSPTQQLSATTAVKKWIDNLPAGSLTDLNAAAFDTRFTQQKIDEVKILSFFVSIFGYGAKPIARRLAAKGASLMAEPVGFYVGDTEGPLLDNELERAKEWAAVLTGN